MIVKDFDKDIKDIYLNYKGDNTLFKNKINERIHKYALESVVGKANRKKGKIQRWYPTKNHLCNSTYTHYFIQYLFFEFDKNTIVNRFVKKDLRAIDAYKFLKKRKLIIISKRQAHNRCLIESDVFNVSDLFVKFLSDALLRLLDKSKLRERKKIKALLDNHFQLIFEEGYADRVKKGKKVSYYTKIHDLKKLVSNNQLFFDLTNEEFAWELFDLLSDYYTELDSKYHKLSFLDILMNFYKGIGKLSTIYNKLSKDEINRLRKSKNYDIWVSYSSLLMFCNLFYKSDFKDFDEDENLKKRAYNLFYKRNLKLKNPLIFTETRFRIKLKSIFNSDGGDDR